MQSNVSKTSKNTKVMSAELQCSLLREENKKIWLHKVQNATFKLLFYQIIETKLNQQMYIENANIIYYHNQIYNQYKSSIQIAVINMNNHQKSDIMSKFSFTIK